MNEAVPMKYEYTAKTEIEFIIKTYKKGLI